MNGHNNRVDRRVGERRMTGSETDVSRLEHENLFRQVHEVIRRIERIELELHDHDARLEALEGASGDATRRYRIPK